MRVVVLRLVLLIGRMASLRDDTDEVASDDPRVVIWEELEVLPLPSLLTPNPSVVIARCFGWTLASSRVARGSSPSSSVAPADTVVSARSLGELMLKILEGDSSVESESGSAVV